MLGSTTPVKCDSNKGFLCTFAYSILLLVGVHTRIIAYSGVGHSCVYQYMCVVLNLMPSFGAFSIRMVLLDRLGLWRCKLLSPMIDCALMLVGCMEYTNEDAVNAALAASNAAGVCLISHTFLTLVLIRVNTCEGVLLPNMAAAMCLLLHGMRDACISLQ